jgi:hypothetical protein
MTAARGPRRGDTSPTWTALAAPHDGLRHVRSRRIVPELAAVSDPPLAHDSSADGLIRRVGARRSRPTPPAA